MVSIPSKEEPVKEINQTMSIRFFKDLSVGTKLNIGFGGLVVILVFLVLISYLASARAKANFERTRDLRLPTSETLAVAEIEMRELAGLLQIMLSLGEAQYREIYEHDIEELLESLEKLDELAVNWTNPENKHRLADLHTKLDEWLVLNDRLLELNKDPVTNPLYLENFLEVAWPTETNILNKATDLIEMQTRREPSGENMNLLKIIADFQSSFNLLTTAVDGYLASVEPDSRALFNKALAQNNDAWEKLNENKIKLTFVQRSTLSELTSYRNEYLALYENIFAAVEVEHDQGDFLILQNQVISQANDIESIFEEMREDQLSSLASDVNIGTNLLSDAQMQSIVGAIISVFLATGLAFAIQRNIAGPIIELIDVVRRFRAGDLDVKARIESKDEIGRLAGSINKMTSQLTGTLAELEQRALIIETSSRVSQRLSTILDQDQLVKEVVDQVRIAFDYYYSHIFLLDEQGEYLVTAGGTGKAGKELVERGFMIPVDKGLVGRAASTNSPVLVSDVTQDENYLPNELLPDTRAEIAIPIAIGDRVLGVLDVQHSVTNGLSQSDVDLLQFIASQVAIALQNARSYEETQRKAEREVHINKINQKILNTPTIEQAIQVAVREIGQMVGAPLTAVHLVPGDPINSQEK